MGRLDTLLEASRFENFIFNAFKELGYNARLHPLSSRIGPGDFIATVDGIEYFVEVKFFTNNTNVAPTLRRGYAAFGESLKRRGADAKGILIVNRLLPAHALLRMPFGLGNVIEFWSIRELLERLKSHPVLIEDFDHFSDGIIESRESLNPTKSQPTSDEPNDDFAKNKNLVDELRERLKNCRESDGPQFESVCTDILKLLFDRQLANWITQSETDSRMLRRDLTARILNSPDRINANSSIEDFWSIISRHFNCRYITFEFKNYSNPIKQGEVLTTEKYLYLTALRSVAIIIARNGADDNSHETMKGALREHGKLILCISPKELNLMLGKWLAGDDAQEVLMLALDERLLGINR